MKKIFVYYSLTGNLDYVASILKKEKDIDILKLEPVKEYPNSGFKKFLWGGKSAVMKEKPQLVKYDFNDNYDEIIIGTPIWAGTFTPPIRTFIMENKNKLNNKKISIILTCSGGNAIKALKELKSELGIEKFNNELTLIDPKDKPSIDSDNKIIEFIKKRTS